MRWHHFIFLTLVALLGVIIQTTFGQVLWFRTPVGWIGPEILAAVAVFVALFARSGTDAVLAGCMLGLAVDLTLSGPGMGLLALLYAGASAGIFRIRGAFFHEKVLTQMVMGFIFCVCVYELWTAYDVLIVGRAGGEYLRPALQALGLSVYTAVLTPLVCAMLKRFRRLLLPAGPPGKGR